MIVSLIVAYDMARGIGFEGRIPWRLPGDLRRFKALTMGHHIIMGRKTWESIGRPLPGRLSLVVSRKAGFLAPGARVFADLQSAIDWAAQAGDTEAFVIGGAEIYALALPLAQRIYATLVLTRAQADTWFPPLNPARWHEVRSEEPPPTPGDAFRYTFLLLEKFDD
jgi:dihydrofolate reductase